MAPEAVQLPPGTATGMALRPQIGESQPAAIVTVHMGGKSAWRSPLYGATMRWRHGIGPSWRGESARPALLLTSRTVGLVRQAGTGFGRRGTLGCGLDGSRWSLGHPAGWVWPEVGQEHAHPEQNQDHPWSVDEVWDHGMAPLHAGERRPFSLVCRPKEFSAAIGYTTVLLLADTSHELEQRDDQIVLALGTSLRSVERIRKRFVTEGIDTAIIPKPQPPRPDKIKIQGDIEQPLVRVACSDPPAGRCHWPVPL
jgi:hypothetical protein